MQKMFDALLFPCDMEWGSQKMYPPKKYGQPDDLETLVSFSCLPLFFGAKRAAYCDEEGHSSVTVL